MSDIVTFEQIESPRPGVDRATLMLQGRCAAIVPATGGVSQRHTITWNEAAGRAWVRLAGPQENPTQFRFQWLTRLMGARDALLFARGYEEEERVRSANDLARLMAAFVRDSALVKLTWRGVTQVGVLAEMGWEAGRADEWNVTVEFQPVEGPGGDSVYDAELDQSPDPLGTAETLLTIFDGAVSPIERGVTWAEDSIDALLTGVGTVRAQVTRLYRDADRIRQLPNGLKSVYASMSATLRQIMNTTADARDLTPPAPNVAQTDDAALQLTAAAYVADTQRQAQLVRNSAAMERNRYREANDGLRIHYGRKGETTMSLAWRYYGTIELADAIAERNGLRSTEIEAGARLVIPKAAA